MGRKRKVVEGEDDGEGSVDVGLVSGSLGLGSGLRDGGWLRSRTPFRRYEFDTAEEAARAYDEAACLLRGANFWPCSPSSALPSKITNLLLQRLKARNSMMIIMSQTGLDQENASFDFSDMFLNEDCSIGVEAGSPNSNNNVRQCFEVEEDEEEEQGVGADTEEVASAIDFRFLDEEVNPSCYYSPFEITQEIAQGPGEAETPSLLITAMERMKYERNFSASLYAFNGVSECLKLRLGSSLGGV